MPYTPTKASSSFCSLVFHVFFFSPLFAQQLCFISDCLPLSASESFFFYVESSRSESKGARHQCAATGREDVFRVSCKCSEKYYKDFLLRRSLSCLVGTFSSHNFLSLQIFFIAASPSLSHPTRLSITATGIISN